VGANYLAIVGSALSLKHNKLTFIRKHIRNRNSPRNCLDMKCPHWYTDKSFVYRIYFDVYTQ